jgi:hypothetical protein
MKTTPERPNLFSIGLRIRRKKQDVTAFIHFLQQMQERDLIQLESTPQFYERQEGGRRGKAISPRKSNSPPWGDAYCQFQFTYPDYPELKEE